MEIKSGVYCIESLDKTKKYIGSSQNVFKRCNRHFSELKNNKHKNVKLQAYYNKYGKENLTFYVLELVQNNELLIAKEQFFIDKEKPWFNINLIANSSLGVKRSEETKEKVRQANLGLKHPEWRNKIKSKAQGGDNHWTKKKLFSEKSKIKMSNTHKQLYKNGYKHPNRKIVYQFDSNNNFIKEWESAALAAKHFGLTGDAITNCARGLSKTSGGYKWKYER